MGALLDRKLVIGIGAAKSGTTSLHYYLSEHPEIQVSSFKEPNFFHLFDSGLDLSALPAKAKLAWGNSVSSIADYEALFSPDNDKVWGDVSPMYMASGRAARNIATLAPRSRLVAILRNPVERAYSHYIHNVKTGLEPRADFTEALKIDGTRGEHSNYLRLGNYHELLRPYRQFHESGQLLILNFEHFSQHTDVAVQQIFKHIGINETVPVATRVRHLSGGQYPEIPRDAIAFLKDYYAADMGRLTADYGIDGESWVR